MKNALPSWRYGLFVHYVPELTVNRSGKAVYDINELADTFDAEGFAEDVVRMGAEYLIFTAWHYRATPLYPSAVTQKYRLPQHFCRRDLLGDLLSACEKRDIPVIFYTHPRAGHTLLPQDQAALGWATENPDPDSTDPDFTVFSFERWNTYTRELYLELVQRYGSRLAGLWLDEGSARGDSWDVVDYPALAAAIDEACPGLWMMTNFYGDCYGLDSGMKEYHCLWGPMNDKSGCSWPVYDKSVAAVITNEWMACAPADRSVLRYSPEALFRYTVLQAAANRQGGGVAWACGPYPGPHADGLWEKDVLTAMTQLGGLLRTCGGVFGTVPSDAFPLLPGDCLNTVSYGCATVSADKKHEYIHILKEPVSPQLQLGVPANGAKFLCAEYTDGTPVEMQQDETGVTLTLGRPWTAPDTVIRLTVAPGSYGPLPYHILDDADPALFYSGSWTWKGYHDSTDDYEGAVHVAQEAGADCRTLFVGGRIEILAPRSPEGGSLTVYIDGVPKGTACCRGEQVIGRQVIFDSGKLRTGRHRLRLVAEGPGAAVDALRIHD